MYLDKDLPLQRSIPGDDRLISRVADAWRSWSIINTRNFIVVSSAVLPDVTPADVEGPLTEELVFRSTIIAASLLGKLSMKSLVCGTPLWFGIGKRP